MLDDLSLFAQIIRSGGLAAAGEKLGLPAATVTRRLARLEHRLGRKLIHRSARKFEMTGDGRAVYEAIAEPIGAAETALAGLQQDLQQLAGPLRVSAPTNISLSVLGPMWSAFVAAHPEVALDLRLSNARVDLELKGIDLAIRIGPQPDSSFQQVRFGRIRTVLVAAPAYLEQMGRPDTPGALRDHHVIGIQSLPEWALRPAGGQRPEVLNLAPRVAVDDITMAADLTRAGHGVTLIALTEVHGDIASGRLVHLLPDWRGPDRDLYLIWPAGRLLSHRARRLKDHIEAFAQGQPLLQAAL